MAFGRLLAMVEFLDPIGFEKAFEAHHCSPMRVGII